jgi:NAD(P)-dependent dehydrogenase (short-subunit alcohol dehydrogenase family)
MPSSTAASPARPSSTSTDPPRVALVTGANRGIGLEVCRQLAHRGYVVLLGARDAAKAARAARQLGGDISPVQLDVADPESVRAAAAGLDRLDVLVNNAAILYDTWQRGVDADLDQVSEALDTNLLGPWRVTQAVLPLLRASPAGRIVNVSSGAGALTDMGGGTPAYRTSKAALNALTRILAAELRVDAILVNAVCPGWVATDMGGAGGRPVADGAAGIVWAATLPDDGPTSGFFRDGRAIDW